MASGAERRLTDEELTDLERWQAGAELDAEAERQIRAVVAEVRGARSKDEALAEIEQLRTVPQDTWKTWQLTAALRAAAPTLLAELSKARDHRCPVPLGTLQVHQLLRSALAAPEEAQECLDLPVVSVDRAIVTIRAAGFEPAE